MERPDFIMLFKPLLEDDKISRLEAEIFGYIYWLTRLKNEKCTAGNNALAELARTSVTTVGNSLTNLEKRGYIRRLYQGSKFGDRAEIIPLLTMAPKPTGEGHPHLQVIPPSPTGEQNKSIEEEHITAATAVAGDEDGGIRQPEVKSSLGRQKKVTPEMQAVFDLFEKNPARHTWKLRVLERSAAKSLAEAFPLEMLRIRYQVSQKYKDDEMCPQINTPSQFLDKMPNLEAFLKRL